MNSSTMKRMMMGDDRMPWIKEGTCSGGEVVLGTRGSSLATELLFWTNLVAGTLLLLLGEMLKANGQKKEKERLFALGPA